MKHLLKIISITVLIVLTLVILFQFVKGGQTNPLYFQTNNDPVFGGPFEQSISSARYALTEAIAVHGSFFLTKDLAQFSSPDVALYKGNFISVFTPGVSLLGVPLYMVGSLFQIPQLTTFSLEILINCINVFLIALLAKKIGANFFAGLFAGLVFLFGTDALAYSFVFTQHPISLMLILLSLLNALSPRTFLNNVLFGIIIGISPLIDIPNLILVAPAALYIFSKHFALREDSKKVIFSFKITVFAILVGIIPLFAFFGWYNYQTTGSFTKIGQFIGNTNYFAKLSPTYRSPANPSASNNAPSPIGLELPFVTRDELNGFYTLLISNERSWIFYSPVVFLGLLGIWISWKSKYKNITIVALATVFVDILTYSMFSDPWGGWNFGPRYLIPAAGVLSIYIAVCVTKYRKSLIFIGVLALLTIYSVWVNAMGALTTVSIPPKVEAIALLHPVPYTFAYNQLLIAKNFSDSIAYTVIFKQFVTLNQYLFLLIAEIIVLLGFAYVLMFQEKNT